MFTAIIVLTALGAVFALTIGGQYIASESGEVVVLESYGADGEPKRTRIWIVDEGGVEWVRGAPKSGWVERVLANPEIRVERRGQQATFRAAPERDPRVRDSVNALMRQKYRVSDRFIALTLCDPERSGVLAFRLEPR